MLAFSPSSLDGLQDPVKRRMLASSAIAAAALAGAPLARASTEDHAVPIFAYHRFASTVRDSMTVREATFAAHLDVLADLGCNVISLRSLVDHRMGTAAALPAKAVVITADDGHISQFEIMAPMLAEKKLCATFFIYPSAISNAKYAMTWPQLQALALRSQWEFGSHTCWHPNLIREQRHMSPQAYLRLVDEQLGRSRAILSNRLTRPIDWLSWPFGLADTLLCERAKAIGYQATVGLGNRASTSQDSRHALPRYLMTDAMDARALSACLRQVFNPTSG